MTSRLNGTVYEYHVFVSSVRSIFMLYLTYVMLTYMAVYRVNCTSRKLYVALTVYRFNCVSR